VYERASGRETALSIQVLGVAGGLCERITGFVGDELFSAFGFPTERSLGRSRQGSTESP
jgi:hypothetical protein